MKWLVLLAVTGCSVTDSYVLTQPAANALAQLPEGQRAGAAVPATRKKDGKSVFVRGSTVDLHASSASGDNLEVKARAPSRMILAGSLLTWIGTGISVTGSILFFATSSGDTHWAGGGLALSAESIMLTGTGLWIAGAGRHPSEVPAGRADLHYLQP